MQPKEKVRFLIDMPTCNAVTPDEAKRVGCHRMLTKLRPFCLGPRCMAWRWINPKPIPDCKLKDSYIAMELNSTPTHGICGEIGFPKYTGDKE